MSFTLKEFLAHDHTKYASIGDCGVCKKPIIGEHPDDAKTIDEKVVHEDCYWLELGNLIEQHPPGFPRRHRSPSAGM